MPERARAGQPWAVFDLDGTLIDSLAVCALILDAMLSDRGAEVPVNTAGLRQLVSAGGERMVSGALGPYGRDPELDLREFRFRYAAAPTPPGSLYPGVRSGLMALHEGGCRLAVCTNKPQGLCDKVLGELGLRHLFELALGQRPGAPVKPDPRLLELALGSDRAKWPPLVYIGDSELDYAFCCAAGVPLVLVTYGYHGFETFPQDVRLANCFDEVPALVRAALAALPPS